MARLHVRVRHGIRQAQNWLQLGRFGAVGASGYVVNLVVFAACVHLLAIDYQLAAVIAFLVVGAQQLLAGTATGRSAPSSSIRCSRRLRFFVVSLVAFGFTYVVLVSLVDGAGIEKVLAQAIAIAAGMPLSFIGQKLWSFRA